MSRTDETVPTDVDVVVLGTGLPESILAAACARVGFTVLHFDRNEHYGGSWASFNLEGIQTWAEEQKNLPESSVSSLALADIQLQEGERLIPINLGIFSNDPGVHYSNIVYGWHLPPTKNADWTQERIMKDWRRFSLDLAPKVLLARGSMVDLLSQSNVGRYAEFCLVNRLLTFHDDDLKVIPCSRNEVFQSTEITMLEKRMLMKFLTFCLNYENETSKWQDFANLRFMDYLSSDQQLTEKLRHYILHSLAMVAPNTNTSEALKTLKEFLMSTGRYGSSPFLWTLYGSGELPQSFCRLCAVFGGIYCLRRSVDAWILDSDGYASWCERVSTVWNCIIDDKGRALVAKPKICTGIVSEGRRVTCRKMVSDCSYLPSELIDRQKCGRSTLSRAILVTDKPLTKADGRENVSLLNYYTEHLAEPVKILESGANGCVCPPGLYVVQMTTNGNRATTAKEELEPVVRKFFQFDEGSEESRSSDDVRPKALWSLFFNCTSIFPLAQVANNVVVTPPLDDQLTFGDLVPRLRDEFARLYLDTDFLPTPPNPDDADVAQADAGNGL